MSLFAIKRKTDRMISLKNGIDKHGLEEFFQKNAIDKKDCVWIVTDRSQVKTADEVTCCCGRTDGHGHTICI